MQMAVAAPDLIGLGNEAGLRLWMEAFRQSNLAVSIVDAAEHTYVLVNPAFAAQRGYRPEELVGRSVWQMVPADILEAARGEAAEAERKGHHVYESVHLCRDGRRLPVEIDATVIRDANGAPRHRLAFVTDTTERKRAEAVLRESERKYRLIVETAYEGIRISSPEGVYTYVNERFARMLGYRVDEILGRRTDEFVFDGWAPRARKIRDDLGGGRLIQDEFKFRRKDGSALWTAFNATAVYDETGRHVANIGMHTDVTDRRRAETALAESEQLLRVIAESTPEPIVVINRDHTLRYTNPAGLAMMSGMLGRAVALQDVKGKTRIEVLGDNVAERERLVRDEQVMASGVAQHSERLMPGPHGERTMLIHTLPLRQGGGEVYGLLGIAVDISRQKQDEARRLAEITRQRDALVREVHHRIKNHLHGVAGLLQNESAAHPALAPHLVDVLGQIRAIAAVYGLQGEGDGVVADLDRVAQLIAAGAPGPVAYRGPDGGALPLQEADAVPVALVVNELVTNALKHRGDAAADRPVRMTLQRSGEDVLLTVAAGPARLPPGFDFAARQGLGIGLELVATLMPSQGASLSFVQDGDDVRADLRLQAPLFRGS